MSRVLFFVFVTVFLAACKDNERKPVGKMLPEVPDTCDEFVRSSLHLIEEVPKEFSFINGEWSVGSFLVLSINRYSDTSVLKKALSLTRLKIAYPFMHFYNITPFDTIDVCGTINSVRYERRVSGGEKSADLSLKGTSYYYGYKDDRDTVVSVVLDIDGDEYWFEVFSEYQIGYFIAGSMFLLKKTGGYQ